MITIKKNCAEIFKGLYQKTESKTTKRKKRKKTFNL